MASCEGYFFSVDTTQECEALLCGFVKEDSRYQSPSTGFGMLNYHANILIVIVEMVRCNNDEFEQFCSSTRSCCGCCFCVKKMIILIILTMFDRGSII